MKKINHRQFFSSLERNELISYVRNGLTFEQCITTLLFDKNIYSELFRHLWMEESIINKSDVFIVLHQRLKDASRNELVNLIEKTIPLNRLIEILISIVKENKNNIKAIKQ